MEFKVWLNESQYITAMQLLNIVKQVHKTEDDFVDANLEDRILSNPQYTLESVPIARISYSGNINSPYIDQYMAKYKELGDYPPIVLSKDFIVIDGFARFEALKRLGLRFIKSYVGFGAVPV